MEGCCNGENLINTLEKSRSVRAFEIYVNGDKIMGSVTFGRFSILKEVQKGWLCHDHIELYPEIKATTENFSK
jgi:hypothetical protein